MIDARLSMCVENHCANRRRVNGDQMFVLFIHTILWSVWHDLRHTLPDWRKVITNTAKKTITWCGAAERWGKSKWFTISWLMYIAYGWHSVLTGLWFAKKKYLDKASSLISQLSSHPHMLDWHIICVTIRIRRKTPKTNSKLAIPHPTHDMGHRIWISEFFIV